MSRLSTSSPFGMVFEHLQNSFHSKGFTSGFPQLFQLYFHIVQGHIPHRITHILGMTYLLVMTKPSCGVCPIALGEALYQFTSNILCFQYCDAFAMYIFPYTNSKLQLKVM
jgi:hypothetical protein